MDSQSSQNTHPPKSFFYNIVLCGHEDTDKNSIIPNFPPNVPKSNRATNFEYKAVYSNHIDTIQIWNVPNMEEYQNFLLTQFSNNIDGIFIIYDRSSENTLILINKWMRLIKCHKNSSKILISINPNGLQSKVKSTDGRSVAQYYGFNFYKALSAQNNIINDLLKIVRAHKINLLKNAQN